MLAASVRNVITSRSRFTQRDGVDGIFSSTLKRELQVYLLVTFWSCLRPASASATCHRLNYSVLGKFFCQNIFIEGYGVSNFIIV